TFFGESDGASRFPWIPGLIEFLGSHETLGRSEFQANAAHPHFGPIRVSPHITERITCLERDFADSQGSTGFPKEPAHQKLGRGEGCKDSFSRRSEDSLHFDLALAG